MDIPAADSPDELPSNSRARLLVVDDDPTARLTLSRLLSDTGEVTLAGSGREALRAVREQKFDVILLDSDMPRMNGLQVCRSLKADKLLAEIPVIFVTGDHSEELETQALEMGASDFLTKPVTRTQVTARVRAQLRIRQATLSRQHAYERLELALTTGHLGTWDWAPDQDKMRWHGTMGNIRGKLSSEVSTLSDHLEGVEDKERKRLDRWVRDPTYDAESLSLEYRVEVCGAGRIIRSRKAPMRGNNGEIIRVIGIDQDVTDWHHSAAQLQSANRQLEQFAYFASHDLQAPARQMAAFARIAADQLNTDRIDAAQSTLGQISSSGERLQSLIKSFLDLSYHRLAEPGEWGQSNMSTVVEAVLEDLRGEIQARQARIHLGAMTGAYIPINLVAHVWLNLILNALQHSTATPPEIWIGQIERTDGAAYFVENRGVPGGDIHSPLEKPRSDSSAGHGLGLLICQNIVRVLGGRLWSERGEQHGLRMLFSIERRAVPRSSKFPR